jgi:hypothetical protein
VVGYISSDGASVHGPNGEPLFYISEEYFCDATGAVLYRDIEDEEEEAPRQEFLPPQD